VEDNGKWLSGADSKTIHKVIRHNAAGEQAFASFKCIFENQAEADTDYQLDKDGLKVTVKGSGKVGLMLPAFEFDGREKCVIKSDENTLQITYRNWVCRYRISGGIISDTGKQGRNRNGYYRLFRAESANSLTVTISIFPVSAN
jgi:hypothetical protein